NPNIGFYFCCYFIFTFRQIHSSNELILPQRNAT
ncbi:MAG: hypothetical protein ACJATF_003399, partial [Flavobacteriales bacterium]